MLNFKDFIKFINNKKYVNDYINDILSFTEHELFYLPNTKEDLNIQEIVYVDINPFLVNLVEDFKNINSEVSMYTVLYEFQDAIKNDMFNINDEIVINTYNGEKTNTSYTLSIDGFYTKILNYVASRLDDDNFYNWLKTTKLHTLYVNHIDKLDITNTILNDFLKLSVEDKINIIKKLDVKNDWIKSLVPIKDYLKIEDPSNITYLELENIVKSKIRYIKNGTLDLSKNYVEVYGEPVESFSIEELDFIFEKLVLEDKVRFIEIMLNLK